MTLDLLPPHAKGRITSIAWENLAPEEAKRLLALGFDSGAEVAVEYRGIFGGRDPLAVSIGEMTVAIRRLHAAAMEVEPVV